MPHAESRLQEALRQNFSKLTKTQKLLAQKLMDNYEDYVFLSIEEAAKVLGVHKSTLVRLAQNLGYSGYGELRADLQALYRQEVSPGKKLGRTLAEIRDDNILQQVVETETAYLREAVKMIKPQDLEQAATVISKTSAMFLPL